MPTLPPRRLSGVAECWLSQPATGLTGHAGTIQELRSDLRARGAVTTATKAHWATGRAGL